jgi:integrase
MPRPSKPWFWKQKQIWCVTINGKRIRLAEDKDEAFRRFHAIKAEQTKLHEDCLLVVMDELLDWTKKHRREGTYRFYVEHAKQLAGWLEDNRLVAIECDQLSIDRFEAYLEDLSPGRRAGAVQVIKRLYNWGMKRGRIHQNPIAALEKPASGRRKNYIEASVFKEMLSHSDENLADLLTFCWETGCRPQEAWRLRPSHVEPRYRRCVIPICETKRNKSDRKIYCNDVVWKLVLKLKENPHFLFTNSVGTQWNKNNIGTRMETLAAHVGKRYALYDIRHTWITNRVKDGLDVHSIAKLAGTSVLMIERYYDHSDQDAEFMLELVNRKMAGSRPSAETC